MDTGALRILHVIPAVAARYGGPSEMVTGICRQLAAHGHQVCILTSDADGPETLNVAHGEPVNHQGVPTVFFPRRYGEAYKITPGLGPWLRANLSRFDIVHLHAVFSWSTLVGGRACLTAGLPYVVRPLGSLDPWSLTRKPVLKRLLLRAGLLRVLRGARALHYTSVLEQETAERALGLANGRVIANAVDVPDPRAVNKVTADPPYLLSLGRLHPKKQLERVITAFAEATVDSHAELVVAGDGEAEYRDTLEALAASSAAAGRIRFAGWVDGAEKDALLADCAAFVLISDNENFGIAAVEAMARARPVLVNRGVYLYPDISRAGAGWVLDDDDADLATLMREVLSSNAKRDARGANARTLVEREYAWPVVTGALEALYRDCLADAGL